MAIAIIIIFFIYGLAFGSFCNVVISRTRSGEKIFLTHSHCPKCKKEIMWKDNIPVISFLLLRGKCRSCGNKISWQYPIVEIVTAILFMLIGFFYVNGNITSLFVAILYSFVFASLVVIFVYDVKYMEIPMNAMWLAIILLFVINITIDINNSILFEDFWHSNIFLHSISALVAFCFFFGLSYISDETWMGYGDSFLAIAIGLMLGPMATFLALMVAFCIGAIVGLGLVITSGKDMKTAIPFGPFLIFGLFVIFVVQNLYPEFMDMFI
jgi:prepilin signal peptidase PulO-like enzyme (type II secretory pathway)